MGIHSLDFKGNKMEEAQKKPKFKTKKEEDFYDHVLEHREVVRKHMNKVITALKKRAESHDETKLEDPEFGIFAKEFDSLSPTTYGSEEYEKLLEMLAPALDRHYAKNRHHPQFFPDGIKGMTLIDLIELLCDWYAATEKHENGNIQHSIEHNKERFKFTKELEQIFKNTIHFFDAKNE